MKEEGIEELPAKIPYDAFSKGKRDSLLNHPALQFRMGAWFFKYCLLKSGWDGESRTMPSDILEAAFSKYNLGQNSKGLNEAYIERVKEEKDIYNNINPAS